MLASGLWCCECRVRIVVLNEVDKIGPRGNAVSPVLEDARQPAVTRVLGHSRYSMSGPNMSQVLANSFVETLMRGNVGAMARSAASSDRVAVSSGQLTFAAIRARRSCHLRHQPGQRRLPDACVADHDDAADPRTLHQRGADRCVLSISPEDRPVPGHVYRPGYCRDKSYCGHISCDLDELTWLLSGLDGLELKQARTDSGRCQLVRHE